MFALFFQIIQHFLPPPKNRSFSNVCNSKTSQQTKEQQQRFISFSCLLNTTASNFNDDCLGLSGKEAATQPHSLSLSKRSAISQLPLKYESRFETSWMIFCHGRFAERDWSLGPGSAEPSSLLCEKQRVCNASCPYLLHFWRCFCAKSVYTKVKYAFLLFFLLPTANICSFGPPWCN